MAHANQVIYNPETKQQIEFLKTAKDTDGTLLEMLSTYGPFSAQPPSHYHPYQAEDFVVIEGELTVQLGNEIKVLKKGDAVHIPENRPHAMWNNSNQKTVVNWKVTPALNTEFMFESAYAIAIDNANKKRKTSLMQKLSLAKEYSNMFRLAKPSYTFQKIIFLLMTPMSMKDNFDCNTYTD